MERAILLTREGTLTPESFPESIIRGKPAGLVSQSEPKTPTLESIEKAYIHWVLEQSEGNKSKAARILGIDASTLYRKLGKYEISDTKKR
jgi:two-component system response regulator HydG